MFTLSEEGSITIKYEVYISGSPDQVKEDALNLMDLLIKSDRFFKSIDRITVKRTDDGSKTK